MPERLAEDWRPAARLIGLGAVLAVIVTHLPGLQLEAWHVDESFTAVIGDIIRDGGVPYLDGVDHRGPATYFVFAAIQSVADLLGVSAVIATRCFVITWIAALTAGVYALAERWFGPVAASAAVVLYFAISSAGRFDSHVALHTEWVLTGATFPAAFLVLSAYRRDGLARYGRLGVAGLLFGLGTLAKQPGGLEAAGAGVFVTIYWFVVTRHETSIRDALRGWFADAATMLSGFCAVLLGMVAYFWAHGALDDAWLWAYRYNAEYYMPAYPVSEREGVLAWWYWPIGHAPIPSAIALVVLAGLGWRHRRAILQRAQTLWEGHAPVVYVVIWLLATYAGAALSGRLFPHYLIPAYAPLALFTGIVFARMDVDATSSMMRVAARGAPIVGAIALLAFAYRPPAERLPEEAFLSMRRHLPLNARPSSAESERIVAEVRSAIESGSAASEPIFVWGWAADLYQIVRRPPATRFVYCSFLVGIIPHNIRTEPVEGSWAMLAADWAQTPPRYVIDTTPSGLEEFRSEFDPTTYPALAEQMKDYELETTILHRSKPYFRLYKRK